MVKNGGRPLHVVFYYQKKLPVKEYGGVERVVVWLIKGLSGLGHRVTLIGPEGSFVEGCAKVDVPFKDVETPGPKELKDYIPKDADIIHFNNDGRFDGGYGVSHIVTIHGALKGVEGLTDNYCFVSDAQRRYWGYPENPVIHHGLDRSEYIYREEKDDYFLFLSRVDWEVKGLPWAIDAAEKAGVRLLIAGNVHRKKFVNSYLRGYLKKRLSDRIQYVGPVGGELKAMLLAKARALIFPTQWCEAFGLVTIEALASGTPVITTRNGAMPEIIEDGKTGYLCGDVDSIVTAIRRVDKLNPKDCLGSVEGHFNHMRMAGDYAKEYRRVLTGA